LVPFRNKLVHGLWSATGLPDTVTVSLVKSGNRLKHQTEFVNIAYLDWLDNQVTRATTLLFGFGSQHDLLGDVETGDENRPD